MVRNIFYFLLVLTYISHISCDDDDDFAQELSEALSTLESDTNAHVQAFQTNVPAWLKAVSDAQAKNKDTLIAKLDAIIDAAQKNATAIKQEAVAKGEAAVACVNEYANFVNKTKQENEVLDCFQTAYSTVNTSIMISQEEVSFFAGQIVGFKEDLSACGKNATCLDDLMTEIDAANSIPEEIKYETQRLDEYVKSTAESQDQTCDVAFSLSFNVDWMLFLMKQCIEMA